MSDHACEICEEYVATHAGKSLCSTCYSLTYAYMRRGPSWVMRRRKNLKRFLKTAAVSMGNVSFIDDREEVA